MSIKVEEHIHEKERKSKEKDERALEKRLTQRVNSTEERHIAKKEKATARKGIGTTKRK